MTTTTKIDLDELVIAGCNGPRLALGSRDGIPQVAAPHRSASCCARIAREGMTGWCHLPDGHEGDHDGVMSAPPRSGGFGPRSQR